ncbi:MAG: DUF1573 domain-containing protein [Opitutales bacterium]
MSPSVQAELVFEETRLTPAVELGDNTAEAVFRFTNTYDHPVQVKEVRTSCGCTAADTDEGATYGPGESGTITLKFEFGSRSGRQVKTARVQTDVENAPPIQLALEVEIPQAVLIEPVTLLWLRQSGEVMEPKRARISVHPEADLRVTSVRSYNPNFTAMLVPLASPAADAFQSPAQAQPEPTADATATDGEPSALAVQVTPNADVSRGAGKIEITAAGPDGKAHRVSMYVVVR